MTTTSINNQYSYVGESSRKIHGNARIGHAADARKVNIKGSGLGLYLARQFIEVGHKGRIWAESEGEGKGATFIVELPAVEKSAV